MNEEFKEVYYRALKLGWPFKIECRLRWHGIESKWNVALCSGPIVVWLGEVE